MTIVHRIVLSFALYFLIDTGLTIFFPNIVKNTQTYFFTMSLVGSITLIIDALKIEKKLISICG